MNVPCHDLKWYRNRVSNRPQKVVQYYTWTPPLEITRCCASITVCTTPYHLRMPIRLRVSFFTRVPRPAVILYVDRHWPQSIKTGVSECHPDTASRNANPPSCYLKNKRCTFLHLDIQRCTAQLEYPKIFIQFSEWLCESAHRIFLLDHHHHAPANLSNRSRETRL